MNTLWLIPFLPLLSATLLILSTGRMPRHLAAMLGAFFILSDPIFHGLAVSLVFGVMVSTVLTLLVIPLLYYAWLSRGDGRHLPAGARR